MKELIKDVFEWEDLHGTDHIVWFEEYNLHLPYWVSYMPEDQRKEYVNEISKTRDFEEG